jgi:transglutaminase-like putative cysteine protease
MSVLAVDHITEYGYAAPVEFAQHLAYLCPRDCEGQRVESAQLDIEPTPSHQRAEVDAFGNRRVAFTLAAPHRALMVRLRSQVRVNPPPVIDPGTTAPWEAVRERLRFVAGGRFEPAAEFVAPSPYVPRLDALREWAAPSFTAGRAVADLAIDLMARVHREFAYRSASTTLDTPLAEVLDRREGVCQDFAHLMIGALRAYGLAARYISGYLLTTTVQGGAPLGGAGPTVPLMGADASHAWLAVWCPFADGREALWLELDPTNDRLAGAEHMRLGVGRDYGDVTPLRGVILGGGAHTLSVRVQTRCLNGI